MYLYGTSVNSPLTGTARNRTMLSKETRLNYYQKRNHARHVPLDLHRVGETVRGMYN